MHGHIIIHKHKQSSTLINIYTSHQSGLHYTFGNCKRPPPEDLLELLAIVGLPRKLGLEATLRCERGDLPLGGRLDGLPRAGEEDWTVILSLRTNIPCLSLHLKYFTPLTTPLFLPATGGEREVNKIPVSIRTTQSKPIGWLVQQSRAVLTSMYYLLQHPYHISAPPLPPPPPPPPPPPVLKAMWADLVSRNGCSRVTEKSGEGENWDTQQVPEGHAKH